MSLSKINEFKDLSIGEIDQKLISIERELLDLRIKKAARQTFKPHQFKTLKRERAQLLTLKNRN